MRHQPIPPKLDMSDIDRAVTEFNCHEGPARIFYNRNSRKFYTRCYPDGGDRWFGPLTDGMDIIELYRKTSDMPDVTVTIEELRLMEAGIRPYSVW
jgi:hypothetical protein